MATGIPVTVGELVDVPTINSWARGYLRKNTAKAVNTTITATDLLNGEFTLPAGAMGTDKIVRLTAWGDWKQNSGASRDIPRFQMILGSTTLIDTGSIGSAVCAVSATRNTWKLECQVQNLGATNSQIVYFRNVLMYLNALANTDAPFTTGNGTVDTRNLSISGWATYEGENTGLAVDTTAACAVVLKVINANNNANYEVKLFGALVEII